MGESPDQHRGLGMKGMEEWSPNPIQDTEHHCLGPSSIAQRHVQATYMSYQNGGRDGGCKLYVFCAITNQEKKKKIKCPPQNHRINHKGSSKATKMGFVFVVKMLGKSNLT